MAFKIISKWTLNELLHEFLMMLNIHIETKHWVDYFFLLFRCNYDVEQEYFLHTLEWMWDFLKKTCH